MALLKTFNPHELRADIVLGVATGRNDQLDKVLTTIRDNISASTKQHLIVSAPRGYGKSFFLRLVEVKIIEMAKEGLPVAMALLSEELPHVKEPDTLIAEITRCLLGAPADSISVRWTEDDGEDWDKAIDELEAALDKRFGPDCGLLIAGVENFDLLVHRAFGTGLQSGRLREFLTRHGNRVMLLAASARGAFDRNYDQRLFKAFDEIALERWTIEQCLDFFDAQRKIADKPPLDDFQRAKAKAVATFIGGTPRLATLIGEALLEQDALRAADLLEQVVDELTPYYKERIEALPSRSQKLLDALLRGGEKCSATALANRVHAPSQAAIAAPLDELKKDLIVYGEKAPDSAEVLLAISDRLFAHYYRKRILCHGQETCPLEALIELLVVYYSPEEKKKEAERFSALGLLREAALMHRLLLEDQQQMLETYSSESIIPKERSSTVRDEQISEIRRLLDEGRIEEAIAVVRELMTWIKNLRDPSAARALVYCALNLVTEKRSEEALALGQELLARGRFLDDAGACAESLICIASSLGSLGRNEEAVAAAQEALKFAEMATDINVVVQASMCAMGAFHAVKRYEEAIFAARQTISKIKPESMSKAFHKGLLQALKMVAICLGELGRHEEAIPAGREVAATAVEMGDFKNAATGLVNAADSLRKLERFEEALSTAREALELAKTAADNKLEARALNQAATCLISLDRFEEALVAAKAAVSKTETLKDPRFETSALLTTALCLGALGRYEDTPDILGSALAKASANTDLQKLTSEIILSFPDPVDAELALQAFGHLTTDLSFEASPYFDGVVRAITKEMDWPRLVSFIEQSPQIAAKISESADQLSGSGEVIVKSLALKDHDIGLAQIRHLVASLSLAIENAPDQSVERLWAIVLTASVRGIAIGIADPVILHDVAEIFAAHSVVAYRDVELLRAASAYHSTKRDPAALARLDPDIATALMAVFPPTAVVQKPKSKPPVKKNTKKKTAAHR